jgi:F-type H+-transporting ATPase subunit epsilon
MAGKTYKLDILTPQRNVFSGDVTSLIAPGTDGLFGVLYDHASMLASLAFGVLNVATAEGKPRVFVLNSGFFEVSHNSAAILVDTAEAGEEVDVARAKAARERAEKRLAVPDSEVDIDRAKAALLRALTRLHAASLAVKA